MSTFLISPLFLSHMKHLISEHRRFTKEEDVERFAIVRVQNSLMKELGGRHKWVEIRNQDSNKKIYRRLAGSGSTDLLKQQIELDYDSSIELGLNENKRIERGETETQVSLPYACNMSMHPVWRYNFFKKAIANWRHPDPAYSYPFKISLTMSAVALLSLVFPLVSLFK